MNVRDLKRAGAVGALRRTSADTGPVPRQGRDGRRLPRPRRAARPDGRRQGADDRFCQEADVRARFCREARSAGRLLHRNIITIFDLGDDGGRTYIVMELLAGATLADYMTRPRRRT